MLSGRSRRLRYRINIGMRFAFLVGMPSQQHSTTHAKRKPATTAKANRWSQRVNETSNALDLESGVFKSRSPKAIAQSLKRSAERSERRKASPYQSAMSMLTFYLNRGGKQLSAQRKQTLEKAKGELKALFGRD
jgi:putative cell wall-binding protein